MQDKLILFLIGFTCLCGYSQQNVEQDKPIKIENAFDEEGTKWFKNTGNGTIKGIAKFTSKNGELRFGKDFRIELMPNCRYTEERLMHIYNNKDFGYVYVEDGVPKFTPDPKAYHDTKKTMCNQEGEFEFSNLPPGNYYVIAFMLWDDTGGGIMRNVILNEDESKAIEMINK